MTKSQLIDRIAQKAPHVPRRDVEAIVNAVFDRMVDALKAEDRIEIRGFGSFSVKVRDAREGRNPKTGQKVRVPRRRAPSFTVGKELRDRLNPSSAVERAAETLGAAVASAAPASAPRTEESITAAPAAAGLAVR